MKITTKTPVKIMAALHTHGPLTLNQLADITLMEVSALQRSMKKMLDAGLVSRERQTDHVGKGQPGYVYSNRPSAPHGTPAARTTEGPSLGL